ncbi:MAG: polymerase subunit epsilon [Actinomycetota bacterium]|jgi:DNA polymerase-3 subunit epsilon|nr:polymerase subunit epsilon [Actinomycetota bacterium]
MLVQRSFDDLGTPLSEVTFCVVDLETTGGSPTDSAITEVGAVKVLRGEVVGTFQTLVDPGQPVPAFIRLLTGITEEDLVEAPPIETVLPSFLEFAKDTVLVAHNARFDISFLNHALVSRGYEPLSNRVIDTAGLARKVVAGEVPNHRLATLASHLRCAHQPCHRAFADVLATIDVLHHLIERVAGFGVVTLEDLQALSASRLDGTFSKISLAQGLPTGAGVYRFLGSSGQTLYVGKATNVRARVRSYFYGDPRRKIKNLLRETQAITVEQHGSPLEAEIAEARAIQRELPPYNRVGKRPATWYLKATDKGRSGKIAPARAPKEDGALYLGPFGSVKLVRMLIDGLRDAAPIHRCSEPSSCNGCAFSEMERCNGSDRDGHLEEVRSLIAAMMRDPSPVFNALEKRMRILAQHARFEEADEVRRRGELLETTLARHSRIGALLAADEIALKHGDRLFLIKNAQLAAACDIDGDIEMALIRCRGIAIASDVSSYQTAEQLTEGRVLSGWLERNTAELEMVSVTGSWALPVGVGRGRRFATRER